MTDFNVGDHVKVTIDAVVVDEGPGCICTDSYLHGEQPTRVQKRYLDGANVSVERVLPPPPEVFKPGDVVRALGTGSSYTLTQDGYVSHSTGHVWTDGAEWRDNEFTSKRYERVEV